MRRSLVLCALLSLACPQGCSDEPAAANPPSAGGSGGSALDASAGSGGVAGTAGLDGGAGSAGLDASPGGNAGQGGSAGSDAGAPGGAGGGGAAGQGGSAGAVDAGGSGGIGGTGGQGGSTPGGIFDCPVDAGSPAASDAATPDAASDAGLSDATAEGSPADAALPDAGATVRVRIVAANITSANYQAYEPPGIRIFQGLAPDIVMIQEFKYRHGTLRDLVDTAFGTSFCFYREAQVGGIPNGVVSRYPISAYGEWQDKSVPDRDFVWARIDVPGPIDLWAVSVHMKTSTTSTRAQEAKDLVADVQAHVPPGDYLVVGGDLNTGSTTETAVNELSSVVVTGGARPADQNGNDRTNQNRNKPYDWVLPDAALAQRELAVVIGASTYASGLVFDSRVYTPLSEVAPVQAGDSGVSGMQHMAVVKDFALPAGP